jgi:lipopolysaccharide transport system ATP-binding protein
VSTAICLDRVSKKFYVQREHPRSLQDLFLFWRRYRRSRAEAFWVLRDISLDVAEGEVVGLIGPNGAGKSTILKLISRIIEPTEGQITVNGRVTALLELGAGFHPDLTGRENVYLNGSVLGLGRREISRLMDDIASFAELGYFFDTPVKHYSSGMYTRLGFSVAVHMDPDVLLIDEVLAVGDEAFQRKCLDKIGEIKKAGKTIIFVSHNLPTVSHYCDRVVWLEGGQVQACGDPETAISQYLEAVSRAHGCEISAPELDDEPAAPEGSTIVRPYQQRWGSGEIQIKRITMLRQDGSESLVFGTGDTLTVRMEYEAAVPVERPVFGIGIRRNDGVHIAGPNSQMAQYDLSRLEGHGVIECRVPDLPLLVGEYELAVAVYDDSLAHPYDHHDWMYRFMVVDREDKPGLGLLHLPCEWQQRES